MDEQNRDNIVRTQSVFGDIARIVYLGGDNCRITDFASSIFRYCSAIIVLSFFSASCAFEICT